jgi:hypothetical protein
MGFDREDFSFIRNLETKIWEPSTVPAKEVRARSMNLGCRPAEVVKEAEGEQTEERP